LPKPVFDNTFCIDNFLYYAVDGKTGKLPHSKAQQQITDTSDYQR